MMKIGIIDADLLGREHHRFPNLVCEKISGYWKEKGAIVRLLMAYEWDDSYDLIYISKVFTDTPSPDWLVPSDRIRIGGTGFFFDQAPDLPSEIEHHMPDYDLYNDWIESEVQKAQIAADKVGKTFKKSQFLVQFKEYLDYSIGYMTRGCFRKCEFCVNKKYDHVFQHSPLDEFYNADRKKICLLDDNFLGCPHWKAMLETLISSKRPFKFKQGLDERLLTDEKCELLFNANYDGDYTFAFDNIADYDLIHSKIKMIRKYSQARTIKFYVLCAFEGTDEKDIENTFKRIELLMRYQCLPYLMRYQNKNDTPWKRSEYANMYIALARWCNQPSIFKKMSFRQFCERSQEYHKTKGTYCSPMRAMLYFEERNPALASKYFDLCYANYDLFGNSINPGAGQ